MRLGKTGIESVLRSLAGGQCKVSIFFAHQGLEGIGEVKLQCLVASAGITKVQNAFN